MDVGERTVGAIGAGLLVLLGASESDTSDDAATIARKVAELRVFEDDDGKMNRTVEDVGGAVLVVSQFTLLGDCRKGRRPSFAKAMEPVRADALIREVITALRARGLVVETGEFGASMDVHIVNRGPVTLLIDSARVF